MSENGISRAALGRMPDYLRFLRELPEDKQNVSATTIAKALDLGEVQVRKDLSAVCGMGKPKIGYVKNELAESIENLLKGNVSAVIVGAGKLGRALLDYSGFGDYGINVLAAFDVMPEKNSNSGKTILNVDLLEDFCRENSVKIGVIAVPKESAQSVCDTLEKSGVTLIWCFAPCKLKVNENVTVQYENLALSLAHLKMQLK